MKRHNLHTHTIYSDGKNSPEELIKKAKESKLEIIGISDHGFTRKTKSLNRTTLPGYIHHLNELKKRSQGIEVKIGLEIDTLKTCGTDPKNLPFELLNQLDYVFFEDIRMGPEFSYLYREIDSLVIIRNKLRIPVGIAHPNLDEHFGGKNEEIAKILGENDIFVDMHLNYFHDDVRHRYTESFLELLRKYNVKFTIGTDVHTKKCPVGDIDPVLNYITENTLSVLKMVS